MEQINGLFITRAQSWHPGHIDAINQFNEFYETNHWTKKSLIKVMVAKWSSDKEWTEDNPLTFDECKDILTMLAKENNINLDIKQLPDFGNNEVWKQYILDNFPPFEYIITWNPHVKEIFENAWFKVFCPKIRVPIKASHIRQHLKDANLESLWDILSPEIVNYLWKIKAIDRMKRIFKWRWSVPTMASDWVIFDNKWKIILIQRKFEPQWLALPWGKVDYWESPQDALVREMEEEIWVKVEIEWDKRVPLWVFWEPERDPRMHMVSTAFKAKIVWWELKAGSDARKIIKMDPLDALEQHFAFEDHKEMIKLALTRWMKIRLFGRITKKKFMDWIKHYKTI